MYTILCSLELQSDLHLQWQVISWTWTLVVWCENCGIIMNHYKINLTNLTNNITIFKGKSSLNHIETEEMWELLVGERERLCLEKTLDIKPLRPGKKWNKNEWDLNFQHRITLWLLPHVTTTLEIPSKKYGIVWPPGSGFVWITLISPLHLWSLRLLS